MLRIGDVHMPTNATRESSVLSLCPLMGVAMLGVLVFSGCVGGGAVERTHDFRFRGSTETLTATSFAHPFPIEDEATAILLRGAVDFDHTTYLATSSEDGRFSCSSSLEQPLQRKNPGFYCLWSRGNASWAGMWQIRIETTGPGSYDLRVFTAVAGGELGVR